MTSLPTLPTRLRAPLLVVNCAYCSAEVECVDDGAFELSPGGEPVRRKLECVVCGKRFLVCKGTDGQAHSSTSLTIQLPSEVLAIIFAYVHQFPTEPTATLFEASLVSRHWNLCATPILYRDIKIDEWDWRMKSTLLRTLDESLSLLPHIRSLSTTYPRFESWGSSLVDSTAVEEYERAFHGYIENLNSEEARDAAHAINDNDDRIPEIWRHAQNHARWKVLEEVENAGASPWMDDKRKGDTGRRAGACELLALVSRSPALTTLRLEKFDFGDVDGDRLESRLPLSLNRIVTLVLNALPQEPNPLPFFLSRVKNIESLDVGDPIPGKCYRFPRLRVLKLRHSLTADNILNVEDTIEMSSKSLRILHLTLKADLAHRDGDESGPPPTLSRLSRIPPHPSTPVHPHQSPLRPYRVPPHHHCILGGHAAPEGCGARGPDRLAHGEQED